MKAFKLGIVMLFHPVVAFRYMQKDRNSFRYTPILTLVLATICVRIFSIYFTHYPLASVSPRSANLFMVCAMIFAPLFSWVIASYAVTTIMEGEMLFREGLMAMAYSLIPYIMINVPLTIASNIMDNGSAAFYVGVQSFSIAWMVILLIISLKVMNHFTMKKTVGIVLLSLFSMVLLWAVILLFVALTMRFVGFANELLVEIQYRIS